MVLKSSSGFSQLTKHFAHFYFAKFLLNSLELKCAHFLPVNLLEKFHTESYLYQQKMLMHLIGHFEKNIMEKSHKKVLQSKALQFVSGFLQHVYWLQI